MNKTDRINEILKAKGLSVSAFAKKLGMPQPTVDRYTKDGSKVSWEFAEKILVAYPDISAEWLLRGEGEMYVTEKPQQTASVGEAYYEKMLQEMEAMKNRLNDLEDKVS